MQGLELVPLRGRTDAQVARKREVDRAKHRANRAEGKLQLERIEQDISRLRYAVGEVLLSLQSFRGPRNSQRLAAAHPAPEPDHAGPADAGRAVDVADTAVCFSSCYDCGSAPDIVDYLNLDSQPSFMSSVSCSQSDDSRRQWAPMPEQLPPSLPEGTTMPMPIVPHCRCGVVHLEQSDCLEVQTFNMLYKAHVSLSQGSQPGAALPRNPTISNLLLLSLSDNMLTVMIGPALKRFHLTHVETLFGLYFLAYRLLRWRLYPSMDSFDDVPTIMRPSEIQDSIPHPLTTDYLPWPQLRDYLCQNQDLDSGQSVDLYIRSIRLRWPTDKQLLCRSSTGSVELHPEFEEVATDIRHWTLMPPWETKFPHLKHLLHLSSNDMVS